MLRHVLLTFRVFYVKIIKLLILIRKYGFKNEKRYNSFAEHMYYWYSIGKGFFRFAANEWIVTNCYKHVYYTLLYYNRLNRVTEVFINDNFSTLQISKTYIFVLLYVDVELLCTHRMVKRSVFIFFFFFTRRTSLLLVSIDECVREFCGNELYRAIFTLPTHVVIC